jgi:hypothetical protein
MFLPQIKKYFVFFFIFITFVSQGQTNDAQLWSEVVVKKKITNKLSFSLANSVRFRENISLVDKVFTELETQYELFRFLDFGLNYRLEQEKKQDNDLSLRHRFSVDAQVKKKVLGVSLSLRTRFQTKYIDYYSSYSGVVPQNILRLRIKASYKILLFPIVPSISSEIYYGLNGEKKNLIDAYRYQAELSYKINKHNDISLGYLIQNEKNEKNLLNIYAFQIGYSFDF